MLNLDTYVLYEALEIFSMVLSIVAIISSLVCYHMLFKHINKEQEKNKAEVKNEKQSQVP